MGYLRNEHIGTSRFAFSRLFWLSLIGVLVAVLGAFMWYDGRSIEHPPGIIAPQVPEQILLSDAETIKLKGYYLSPVAEFKLNARVLGKKMYRLDHAAGLAPYDLAVGWGPMSDSSILESFLMTQDKRAYAWKTDRYPIPQIEVVRHSTNMHLIPSSGEVLRVLQKIRKGHMVALEGYLVNVIANDGTRWNTSLSRLDAGVGACEIVWVRSLQLIDPS